MDICKRRNSSFDSGKALFAANAVPGTAGNLTVTFSSQLNQHSQVPSAAGAVPLLNYQPALYQQATINIPGLAQPSIPMQTRPTQLCAQTEPFQQTLIVCPPTTIQGELEQGALWVSKPDLTCCLAALSGNDFYARMYLLKPISNKTSEAA